MRKRIVETDNFGRDYPDETFVPIPAMSEEDAKVVADIINRSAGPQSFRFWKVVDTDYELAPAFEP